MELLVGTFNTPTIYTLRFDASSQSLTILRRNPAIGSHSWLALSSSKKNLYATAWLDPPSVVSYSVHEDDSGAIVTLLNQRTVASRSGYVCCSDTHLYSAGGPSGEAFSLNIADGSIGELLQTLGFLDDGGSQKAEDRPHGDFGGLRHGAHSVDLSPDGKRLFVADIGCNCVWTFTVDHTVTSSNQKQEHLKYRLKCVAPRAKDGPRHSVPHPNGQILYSLQEHSSMVDALVISSKGKDAATALKHEHGVSILPSGENPEDYWADEVRVSHILNESTGQPKYVWASTRGLKPETKGYVGVYALSESGLFANKDPIHLWQTPTSGGIANAVEPAPSPVDGVEYAALTDSEEGSVFVLAFDGKKIEEITRVKLAEGNHDGVVKAATAVWL